MFIPPFLVHLLCAVLSGAVSPAAGDAERQCAILQDAIHLVYRELVLDKKIGSERRILRALRPSERNTYKLRSFGGEGIECLRSASRGSKKEPAEESGTSEGEEPGIDARRRAKSGNSFRLLPVNDPHDG